MSDASTSSMDAMFQAVFLTALASHGDEPVNDAHVVDELKQLDARFAHVDFELGVKARALLTQEGMDGALEQIAARITTADRELTFALCVRVMMADGKTDGEEAMVLGTLQELFQLSPAAVQRHLDEERTRRASS